MGSKTVTTFVYYYLLPGAESFLRS